MSDQLDYGPFPVGTLCLCVGGRFLYLIGKFCHVSKLLNEELPNVGRIDYEVIFPGERPPYRGDWAGRFIVRVAPLQPKEFAGELALARWYETMLVEGE